MDIYIKHVTPEIAKELLEKNYRKQRPVAQRHVDMLTREMAEGRWMNLADGDIVIDANGNLIDGQHRLLAVIQSGMTVPFAFKEGIPTESYKVIDSGKKRTAADVIGGKYAAHKSSLARAICGVMRGYSLSTVAHMPTTTKTEAIECYENMSDEIDTIVDMFASVRAAIGRGGMLGIGLAMWAFAETENIEVVKYFCEDVSQLVPNDERIAVYKNQCQKSIIEGSFDPNKQLSLTLRMLDAIKNDEYINRFTPQDKTIKRFDKKLQETFKGWK